MSDVREAVREHYGKIGAQESQVESGTDNCCQATSCCPSTGSIDAKSISKHLGYSEEQVESAPEGANLGLGCGNPQSIAQLQPGEVVLDLGCGGGFDCFLAAEQVGTEGQVIGVDMTPEMLQRARKNAQTMETQNVDFRLGEIENLPIADDHIDVILSNCVINLSDQKQRVFQEAFRVLKPGGRLAISDVVALKELPKQLQEDIQMHMGCIAGAATVSSLETMLSQAGFSNIQVQAQEESKHFIKRWLPGSGVENWVRSANIEATKPTHTSHQ